MKRTITHFILLNADLDRIFPYSICFVASREEYYKMHRERSAVHLVANQARNENKDEHLTILSQESPRGTRDSSSKPWLTGTSAGCWMLGAGRRLGGIIPNHLSLGQANNPFRCSRSLARLRFLLPLAAFVSFYSRESSQYADKKLTTPALGRNSRTD